MKFLEWRNASAHNGFSFYLNETIPPGETMYVKMPVVSANKRGVNDIGFAYDDGIKLYATLSEDLPSENTIWQDIQPFDEINKTVAYIKIQNSSENNARINLRAILN